MKNLIAALAKFQRECPAMEKDGKGYGYNYATLDNIKKTITPLMEKHGLAYTQPIEVMEGVRYLVTIVWHVESGEDLRSRIDIPEYGLAKMNGYQAMGSAITYLRRYCLASLLGIVTEDDKDAAGTQEGQANKTPAKQPAKQPAKPAAEPGKAPAPTPANLKPADGNPVTWLNRERPKGSGKITEDWANAVAYLRGDIPRPDGQEPKIADLETRYKISKAGREQLMNDTLDLDFLKPKDGDDLPPDNAQGSLY